MPRPSPEAGQKIAQEGATAPRDSVIGDPPKKKQYERRKFLNEGGTGDNRLARGEARSEKFEFSDEVIQGQERFIKNYLKRLKDVEETVPGVLANPNHRIDQQLLTALRGPKKGPGGELILDSHGNPIMEIDETKIATFLNSDEGRIVTNQVMEQQLAYEMFALGIHAAALPPGERVEMVQQRIGNNAIRLGIDQSVLDRFLQNRVVPWLTARVDTTGGRPNGRRGIFNQRWQATLAGTGASAALGLVGHNVAGSPGLVAGLAALPVAAGFNHLLRRGVVLEMRQCVGAFNSIANNHLEAAYIKAMAGIDVNDFQVAGTPGNEYLQRTNRVAETQSIKAIQRDILEKLDTRNRFYIDIGANQEDLDATAEQFLFRYFTGGQKEGINTTWGKRINERFKPNAGGILDMGGLRPNQPGFNANDLDYEGNLHRHMRARRNVIAEMMEKYIRTELSTQSSTRSLTAIDRKIAARGENGTLIAARKAEITAEKTAFDKDRSLVDAEKTKLQGYKDVITALQNAREQAQQEFGVSNIANIDTEITKRRDSLTDHTIVGSYAQKQFSNDVGRKADIATEVGSIPATLVGKGRAEESARRVQAVNQRYDRMEARLKEEVYDKVNEEINRLKTLRQQINTQQKAFADSEQTPRQAREQFEQLTRDFDTLVGTANGIDARLAAAVPPIAAVGLNEAALRDLPIADVLRLINEANRRGAAYVPPIAIGWPESQNDRPELRSQLLRGRAEARSQQMEATDPTRATHQGDYTALTGWNITENQLRSLDTNELLQQVNDEHTRNPANGWPAAANAANTTRVEHAAQWAQGRLQKRLDALEVDSKDFEELAKQREATLDAVDFKAEVDQLQAIKHVMTSRGAIQEKTLAITEDIDRYTNDQAIAPADRTFTQTEKDAAQPRGYYEILDVLFDYKTGTEQTDRATYFQAIQRLLPPDELRDMLNTSLSLGLAGPGLTMANVLTRIRIRVRLGLITPTRLGSTFNNIANVLIDIGEAI